MSTTPTPTSVLGALIRDGEPGQHATHHDTRQVRTYTFVHRLDPKITEGFEGCQAAAIVSTVTTTFTGGKRGGYTSRARLNATGLTVSPTGQPHLVPNPALAHPYTLRGTRSDGTILTDAATRLAASRLDEQHQRALAMLDAANTAPDQ